MLRLFACQPLFMKYSLKQSLKNNKSSILAWNVGNSCSLWSKEKTNICPVGLVIQTKQQFPALKIRKEDVCKNRTKKNLLQQDLYFIPNLKK